MGALPMLGSLPGDPHGIMGMGALPTALGAKLSTPAVEHQANVGNLGQPYHRRRSAAK